MDKILARSRAAAVAGAITATVALAGSLAFGAPPITAPYLANFPNFAPIPTPQLPGDVDITLKTKLENGGLFPRVQREFDLNAWQMFLAVNWPTDNKNRPALRITDRASARRAGRCGTTAARFSRSTARRPSKLAANRRPPASLP